MLVHRCIEEIKRNSYGVVFILWGLKMDNNEKYYVPDKAFIWNHFSSAGSKNDLQSSSLGETENYDFK